ncbi:MAG: RHS repeat-associated core domain-containing protein [Verrucomicrobiota bacterium]
MKMFFPRFFGMAVMIFLVAGANPAAAQTALGTWMKRASGTSGNLTGIAYGDGTFVQVGESGRIATSTNAGTTWTARSAGISRTFNGVAYGNGRFIAVCKYPDTGTGATLFVSDDRGAKWTYRESNSSFGLHAVANRPGSSTWVAAGGFGKVTRSGDNGQTWTSVFNANWNTMRGVVYGNGKWIAGAELGGIYASGDDGVNWISVSSLACTGMAYGNGRFVVSTPSGLSWSKDALTWTSAAATGGAGDIRGVCFGDDLFVAVRKDGKILTSENGKKWDLWNSPYATPLRAVAFGRDRYLCAGDKGALAVSPPWLKSRIGTDSDYPFTVFDSDDAPPNRIGLPRHMVNTASLNLVLKGTLFFAETTGVPLQVRAVYNSQPNAKAGLIGKSWRLPYESALYESDQEAVVVSGGGRPVLFSSNTTLSSATPASPITLTAPDGNFDELKCYGSYYELKKKSSRLTLRFDKPVGGLTGRLTAITDRNGNKLTINYSDLAAGLISSVVDPSARSLIFAYDNGLCSSISVPDGRVIRFEYDSNKQLTAITDMKGYRGAYTYDSEGFLTSACNDGRMMKFSWVAREIMDASADKSVASVTDPAGRTTKYAVADGVTTRTDPLGKVTTLAGEKGQTSRATDAGGRTKTVSYNPVTKLPETFTDPTGDTSKMGYDGTGNLVKTTDATDASTEFSYDAANNLLSRKNALGKTWLFTYDPAGNLLTSATPLGYVTTRTYFPNGRIKTITDPIGVASSFTYDAYGNPKTSTDAAGGLTTFTWSGSGLRCTGITDAELHAKTIAYDGNDRILSTTYTLAGGDASTSSAYNEIGQTSFTDELGGVTGLTRDSDGFVTQLTDPLGFAARTVFDADHNPIEAVDQAGSKSSTTFDADGRPLIKTGVMGEKTTRAYDADGRLSSFKDQKGGETKFAYNKNGILTGITPPSGKVVAILRDTLGRESKLTNARGQEVEFLYDDDGRLVEKKIAGTSASTFSYDAASHVTSKTDASGKTDMTYGSRGEVTGITWPDGKTASFTFNESGLPKTISYPGGLVATYYYDQYNRIPIPSEVKGAPELVGAGSKSRRITKIEIAQSGKTTEINFACDAAARAVSVTRPNGIVTNFAHDAAGRLVSVSHVMGNETLAAQAFDRDPLGNVIRETAVGTQILDDPPLPAPATFAYNTSSQITTGGGKAHTYDLDGNLLSIAGGSFTAVYDALNRPLSITRNGTLTTCVYDSDGRRYSKTTGPVTRIYHYGPGGDLLFETDGTGAIVRANIWASGSLVATLPGGLASGALYPLAGRSGNILLLTKPDGTVAAKYAYDPYGHRESIIPDPSAADNPFTFAGALGVVDDGDGLFLMTHRYYSADAGRFLQKDPLGLEGGDNLYLYAGANPVNLLDPMGTASWREWGWTALKVTAVVVPTAIVFVASGGTAAPFATAVILKTGATFAISGAIVEGVDAGLEAREASQKAAETIKISQNLLKTKEKIGNMSSEDVINNIDKIQDELASGTKATLESTGKLTGDMLDSAHGTPVIGKKDD